ncbi:hypothetical protein [Campylobacter hyointestinalis]|uniref:hypothetical protein n=1 Tax=Campylobacter hyointestinalis TaxID=198 RepID=UPI0011ABB76F|nr:hypothetical protein [Campylobacter hyointestinalis]TWO22805.1 hypothetical protein YZ80_00750 [Campylobacter hyointestinalis]
MIEWIVGAGILAFIANAVSTKKKDKVKDSESKNTEKKNEVKDDESDINLKLLEITNKTKNIPIYFKEDYGLFAQIANLSAYMLNCKIDSKLNSNSINKIYRYSIIVLYKQGFIDKPNIDYDSLGSIEQNEILEFFKSFNYSRKDIDDVYMVFTIIYKNLYAIDFPCKISNNKCIKDIELIGLLKFTNLKNKQNKEKKMQINDDIDIDKSLKNIGSLTAIEYQTLHKIIKSFNTPQDAIEFVHSELDAASWGDDIAVNFVRNSGINKGSYYKGMHKFIDNKGTDILANNIAFYCQSLILVSMTEVRNFKLSILDKVMQIYKLGKYQNIEDNKNTTAISNNTLVKKEDKHLNIPSGRLNDAEVDLMFIVKNNQVVYINYNSEHLFIKDKDGDLKLDGKIVRYRYYTDNENIEIFVAFDDQDSYTLFTMCAGVEYRLQYVAISIMEYFTKINISNLFSYTENYKVEYEYPYNLYRKANRFYVIDKSQSKCYIIDNNEILIGDDRDSINKLIRDFWGVE